MNKKIFTLLASSLMLFMAVFTANARPWVGDTVKYLPQGIGKGAYHLQVTRIGNDTITDKLLAMDDYGFVGLVGESYIYTNYTHLRRAMWCVNVKQENYGQVPAYTFINKEYSTDLAVMNSNFKKTGINSDSPNNAFEILRQYLNEGSGTMQDSTVRSTGEYARWWFSRTYNTTPLEKHQYLRVELRDEPDYFLTLGGIQGTDTLFLAKVHKNDFEPTSDFAQNHLVRFTLTNAAPRVLTADDFNTKLHEAKEGFVQMFFSRNVSGNQINVFDQPLWAEDAYGTPGDDNHYLTLQSTKGYLHVSDDYYNEYGTLYPIIKDELPGTILGGTDEFRLVYYPSEDSLAINAREVEHADGLHDDDCNIAGYTQDRDSLYNWETWNYLIVRIQDMDSENDRVITAYNKPPNTRISFGIGNCDQVEPNRTTVKPDLYTVQDSEGRYLVVPMVAGDFTPQWKRLDIDDFNGSDTLEVALKTPSYQWFVTKVNDDSETSRIFLTNREFDFIRLEYVQIYKDNHEFEANWHFYTDLNPGADYNVVESQSSVSVDGFKRVSDDPLAAAKKAELVKLYGTNLTGLTAGHQVENWMHHMPQDLLQKLYRTGPFLGYKAILPDTLNYFGYSFNYLHKFSSDYFFGVSEKTNSNSDTSLYVAQERTFFELNLPDTLRRYGREKYGLGHGANSIYQRYADTKDIAPLERYFYHYMINDYYKFNWNDNYLVLDDNARYVYTDEATANSRRLNKAKFYMRFTYEKNNTEYYAFVDRIDKSNFEYLMETVGLQITDTLKAADESHGSIREKAFGVIVASVDDHNLYVRARVKTLGAATISTFALGQMQDELYRRFDTGLEECGRGETGDEPRTLKFYRYTQPNWFVYEDAHSAYSVPLSGINFMGVENVTQVDPANGQWFNQHNYAIYVDTAYVNRGTGHIKPQYLLVMDPVIERGGTGCNACGDSIDFRPYVYGRYLRNMMDSARVNGTIDGKPLDKNYIWNVKWERLAFTEAIHAGDSLYILNGTPISVLYSNDANGNKYLNFALIKNHSNIEIVPLDNNYHKDEVFSMRFVDRQRDLTGKPITDASKRFFMESETTNRDFTKGRMIAPMLGGWVKWQNGVPVISRGSYRDAIMEAEIWEVECASVNDKPTANDDVLTAKVTVVSGNGNVTILNAAGKQVVISNVLGQTIANEVLTSDNATIQAPKGIVVVAIEGENAIKTIVK